MRKTAIELEIQYFPQTDTLYIGGDDFANDGYDIAENLIAHANDDGHVVGITLEHAAEVLAPYLNGHMRSTESKYDAFVLRDDGEPN